MRQKNLARTVVVDESVTASQLSHFKTFAEESGLVISDYVFVQQQHPGIPDAHILRHLLNAHTIFVTSDRPLHNTALSKGLASYYMDEEKITKNFLRGIHVKPDTQIPKKESLKESYLPSPSQVRALLLSDSPQWLKKLTTKRRRIRNHFGGLDQLEQIAVTVSWRPLGTQTLIGVRVQVSSQVGVKAINASESYTAEAIEAEDRGMAAICHALALVIQLLLHSVRTIVYYDVTRIDDPMKQAVTAAGKHYRAFFDSLRDEFEQLEFVPVSKGKHLETLRNKLSQLAERKTNEITAGNIQDMMYKVCELKGETDITDVGRA